MASAATPRIIVVAPSVALAVVQVVAVPSPHPHLPADHHDPIALGTEVGVLLVALFVGSKLVVCRLIH